MVVSVTIYPTVLLLFVNVLPYNTIVSLLRASDVLRFDIDVSVLLIVFFMCVKYC